MTSRRPYRDAMSREAALIEVASNSGTQFDPEVIDSFLMVIRRSPDGYYEEQPDDFGPRIETGVSSGWGSGRGGRLVLPR